MGLPRGHRRVVLQHEQAVRREPLLPARREPLDRDAAGAGSDAHRRRLRVPPPTCASAFWRRRTHGAGTSEPHRVGLPAVPGHPRALPLADAEGVLPAQLLGGRRGQRAGDRGDRLAHRRGPMCISTDYPHFDSNFPNVSNNLVQAYRERRRRPSSTAARRSTTSARRISRRRTQRGKSSRSRSRARRNRRPHGRPSSSAKPRMAARVASGCCSCT